MQTTIWRWILWILILGYPWPRGQLKIKNKPFNIFLLQINRSINSLSMTTIISNRSIGGMHAFPGGATHAPVGERKKKSFCVVVRLVCWFCVCVLVGGVFFLPLNLFCPFFLLLWNAIFSSCCHINISCFSSPLSLLVKRAGDLLKILLYLFQESSSAGRTIDSSSFSFLSFLSFFCPDQHWRKIGRAAWSVHVSTARARSTQVCLREDAVAHKHTHVHTHTPTSGPNTAAFLQDKYFRHGNKAGKWEKFGSGARFEGGILTLLLQELQKLLRKCCKIPDSSYNFPRGGKEGYSASGIVPAP